jgi:hypothetical protein
MSDSRHDSSVCHSAECRGATKNRLFQVGTADFIEELRRRSFPDALDNDVATEVSAAQLTLPYLNQTGFRNPILVRIS